MQHWSEKMSQYECLLCRIATGHEPASKVHEDEYCLVFLDLLSVREGCLDEIASLIARHMDD